MILVQGAFSSRTLRVREAYANRTIITFDTFIPLFRSAIPVRQSYDFRTVIVRVLYVYRTCIVRVLYVYCTIIVRVWYDYRTIFVRLSYELCHYVVHSPRPLQCIVPTLPCRGSSHTYSTIPLVHPFSKTLFSCADWYAKACLPVLVRGAGHHTSSCNGGGLDLESFFTRLAGHRVSEHVGL